MLKNPNATVAELEASTSLTSLQQNRTNAPEGARALFVFHSSLLAFWVFVQVFHRVAPRSAVAVSKLPLGVASLLLIIASLIVTSVFARGQRGKPAEGIARVAVVLAGIDVICEALQLSPELGLPAFMPDKHDFTEFVVRAVWVSCEFAMRSAVFVALWRVQSGADRRYAYAFFGLVTLHWVLAMISFAKGTDSFAAWWNAQTAVLQLLRLGPWLGMAWLSILVWLSYRVASGRHPATSNRAESALNA